MKLYLSSNQVGADGKTLRRLVGSNRTTAVIGNAMDGLGDASYRAQRIDRQSDQLRALDLDPVELDLRAYFGKANALERELDRFGLIWVHGGNSFVLKRAFEQSGLEDILDYALHDERLAYGGFSAALMMVTPTLRGIELCDDAAAVPEGYDAAFEWEGLGLVDYSIVPHYRSHHPESAAVEAVVQYMTDKSMPFRTLRDGEAIVVDGGTTRLVGAPMDFFPGQIFSEAEA